MLSQDKTLPQEWNSKALGSYIGPSIGDKVDKTNVLFTVALLVSGDSRYSDQDQIFSEKSLKQLDSATFTNSSVGTVLQN